MRWALNQGDQMRLRQAEILALGGSMIRLDRAFWRRAYAVVRRLFIPASSAGRPRHPWRLIILALIFRMRTGCPWRSLPWVFGRRSTVHGWLHKFATQSVGLQLWRTMVAAARRQGWRPRTPLLLDASMVKSPYGGSMTGPSPVHRGRKGCKRSLLTDAAGIPLSLILAPANNHDSRLVAGTLRETLVPVSGNVVVADLGYRGANVINALRPYFLRLQLPHQGEVGYFRSRRGRPKEVAMLSHRWKVERSFAWLNACRGLATCYERRSDHHRVLLELWAALVWSRHALGQFTN